MNQYKVISGLALLLLVGVIPLYAWQESDRMAGAQIELRQVFVSDAAVMYVENCALCHGAQGEGIGTVPGLDSPGLWTADYDDLYKTIARGRYGTTMAGWHSDEGGIFNDYQVDEMVALIRYVDWSLVGELAAARGLIPPTLPVPVVEEAFLQEVAALSPEGAQWAEGMRLYANNCTVCHGVAGEGSDLGLPLNTAEIQAREAADLSRTISEGVAGTAMVGWSTVMGDEDIADLVIFLQNWEAIEAQGLVLEAPAPIRIDLDNPTEVLALGDRLYSTVCSACHGENGSGGTGPALNSLNLLTNKSDEQITSTIINGGHRPNSTMPAFGDRLTSVEIGALVDFIRAWEPNAQWVANPRGTQQGGGGPPWLRATPDPNNPIEPGAGGSGGGKGSGSGSGQGGGPRWAQEGSAQTPAEQAAPATQGPTLHYSGEVVSVAGNTLTFQSADGAPVEAMLGPPWFWSESGILLSPGDQIELEGFESADHMEVNWLTNHTTGGAITLRGPDGLPVWSSGGSQGGQGGGVP